MKKFPLFIFNLCLIPTVVFANTKCPEKVICTNIGEKACVVISDHSQKWKTFETFAPGTYNFAYAFAYSSEKNRINCILKATDHNKTIRLSLTGNYKPARSIPNNKWVLENKKFKCNGNSNECAFENPLGI